MDTLALLKGNISKFWQKIIKRYVLLKKLIKWSCKKPKPAYLINMVAYMTMYGFLISIALQCLLSSFSILDTIRYTYGCGILFWFASFEIGPWIRKYLK